MAGFAAESADVEVGVSGDVEIQIGVDVFV